MNNVLGFVLGIVGGSLMVKGLDYRAMKYEKDFSGKMAEYYQLYNKWLYVRQHGGSLEEYFTKHEYKEVAVYGLKELGERLLDELLESKVAVKYVIDRSADELYMKDMTIVRPCDILAPVDAIIVTAVHYYEEIKKDIEGKLSCPIISLAEIVDEMY